jgi:hypothetical protein
VRRLVLMLSLVAGALVAPATAAFAHGADAAASTAFRTTVVGLTRPMTGLSVRAVDGGARLELRNETGRTIEILGYAGEPYLEVRPDGTYRNLGVPTAPPSWRRISGSTTVRWHDKRTQWPGPGLPSAATADPSRAHRIGEWSVPLRDQATEFAVRGTLDWLPAPAAWLWWAGAAVALIAFGIAAMVIPAGLVALIGGSSIILYAVVRTLDSHSTPLALVVSGAAGIAAGVATLRRRAPFVLALAGAVLALFGGFANAGVFGAAVLPVAGPFWLARLCVLVAVGAGLAMVATGVRGLRLSTGHPGGARAAD